ncbi:hypothetical protein RYX36_005590 [Vicia faba]
MRGRKPLEVKKKQSVASEWVAKSEIQVYGVGRWQGDTSGVEKESFDVLSPEKEINNDILIGRKNMADRGNDEELMVADKDNDKELIVSVSKLAVKDTYVNGRQESMSGITGGISKERKKVITNNEKKRKTTGSERQE